MKKSIIISVVMALICVIPTKAQVMKAADLEKYAKQRYGEKWLDAAATIGRTLTFDKNESLTYQEIVQAPGKTMQQLYITLNYWATATFKDRQAITLNDKEAGCIIISSCISNIAEHMGTINKYSVSITPIIRIDIEDQKVALKLAEQKLEEERLKLVEAMKEKKMYERLREKAYDTYLEEEKHDEGVINDEHNSYVYGTKEG